MQPYAAVCTICSAIDYILPAEAEANYYNQRASPDLIDKQDALL